MRLAVPMMIEDSILLSPYVIPKALYESFRLGICTGKRGPDMSRRKKTPEFKTEAEERQFWENHDSTEYVDWNNAQIVAFPNLKPSTKTISIRLPAGLLERIKIEANKRDMPYQSLIKAWLAEDVKDSQRQR